MYEEMCKSETSQINVNVSFDDFLYSEIIEFCATNNLAIDIFIKKLIIRYLNSVDGFRIIK